MSSTRRLSALGMHINPEIADAFGLKIIIAGVVAVAAGSFWRGPRRRDAAKRTPRCSQSGRETGPAEPTISLVGRLATVCRLAQPAS